MIWTSDEIFWLVARFDKEPRELFREFSKRFNYDRGYEAFMRKVQRLKKHYAQDEPAQAKQKPSEVMDGLLDQLAEMSRKPVKVLKPLKSNKLTLVLFFSDTHRGKLTDIFDCAIFDKRISEDVVLRIKHVCPYDIDEIVVVLGGDMVEGEDIYPTQSHHIECSVIEQVMGATEAFWKMLVRLLDAFPKVRIRVETAPGNHGRMSKTANARSNWDNVLYAQLAVMSRMWEHKNAARLSVHPNFEEYNLFEVKDSRLLINHYGKQHYSTPAGVKQLPGWHKKFKFNLYMHGHWHHCRRDSWMGIPFVSNGCLSGVDDHTLRHGSGDEAEQTWFLVGPGNTFPVFSYFQW